MHLATVLVVQPGSVVLVVWMPCSSQVEQSSDGEPAQRDTAEETEEVGEQGRGAPDSAGLQRASNGLNTTVVSLELDERQVHTEHDGNT